MRTVFTITLLLVAVSSASAQPPWVEQYQREREADKRYYEQVREQAKRQRESEREARKRYEEMCRERAKKRAEWEKESFKAREEQQRERDKFFAEQWREQAKHEAEMYRFSPYQPQDGARYPSEVGAGVYDDGQAVPRSFDPHDSRHEYRGDVPPPPVSDVIPSPSDRLPQPEIAVPPRPQPPQFQHPAIPYGNPYDPPPINYGPRRRPVPLHDGLGR